MKHSLLHIATVVLIAAPVTSFAHPGHFEGAPFAHAVSHGIVYLLGITALIVFAAQKASQLRRSIRNDNGGHSGARSRDQ